MLLQAELIIFVYNIHISCKVPTNDTIFRAIN